jgi:hypothetical protein
MDSATLSLMDKKTSQTQVTKPVLAVRYLAPTYVLPALPNGGGDWQSGTSVPDEDVVQVYPASEVDELVNSLKQEIAALTARVVKLSNASQSRRRTARKPANKKK